LHSRFKFQRAPSALRILIAISTLAFAGPNQGCSPAAGYQQPERPDRQELNSLFRSSFEKQWSRATIVLGSQSSGGGGFPFLVGVPGERSGDPFPLIVHATLMDSMLVEAGIREFGRLASMDTSSLDAYRQSYSKRHFLDEFVFVYMEIQTSLAEEYLEADRWIFFVEDQERNQIEPVRVVQHPIQRQAPRTGSLYEPDSPAPFLNAKRIIGLYFPLKRFREANRVLEGLATLKFVVLDINNSLIRAEGMWDLTGPD